MSERINKRITKAARQSRTRSTVHGTAERPRLAVFVSNKHVSAQVINDDTSRTLAAASTYSTKATGTMTEQAEAVGKAIAAAAKKAKVTKVVFDRRDKQYHGRVKALADTARKEGLEF